MDEFYILDPAMGSGHFLTSVSEEIVNIRQELYRQMDEDEMPSRHRLKKTTVLNNIYGVDIVGPAVEIGKLRLWLSVIAELAEDDVDNLTENELALPNIAFNLRQGNSLIGFTGFPEKTGTGDSTFERYQEDSVRSRYEDIINEIHSYQNAITSEQAEKHRQTANELLEESRISLRDEIKDEFIAAGIDDITDRDIKEFSPFHWVLEFAEVYHSGGFDVIVGNPPWDLLTPNREEFFTRYDSQFRTRPNNEKAEIQEELLEDEEIAESWEQYQDAMQRRANYFNDSESYQLQTPKIAGKTVANNRNELSSLFLERVYSIGSDDCYIAQVLPGTIFSGSNTKDVRLHLLDETEIESIIGFENNGIFDGLHNQYKFGVTTFKNSGTSESLRGTFQQKEVSVLNNIQDHTIEIPRRVLREYSPEARVFPFVTKKEEVDALNEILKHPSLGEVSHDGWTIDPYSEIHRTKESEYFIESQGDYSIYEGKNIYQFEHDPSFSDIDEISLWGIAGDSDRNAKKMLQSKGVRKLKKAIYTEFGGEKTSKTQVKFVDELLQRKRGKPLSDRDVLPDHTEYRIGIRDITNKTNERTLIAAVLPKEVVCVNTIHTVQAHRINPSESSLEQVPLHDCYERIFTDKELFAALGLLNSLPFDFLMRTKVESHIVMYKLRESQMPRLTEGDDWFEHIWTRAAKLNCYGEAFGEMRNRLNIQPVTAPEERKKLQAEIDAGAFYAYGLNREQTEFLLEDFNQVENPRRMTDEYFDLVLEKYDELTPQQA
jgi:hypothetical protein